jgi:serine/threonine protein kinase
MSDCLNLSSIVACHQGTASPDESAHLDDCPECQASLRRLEADDAFADEIRLIQDQTRQLGRPALPSIPGFELVAEIGRGGMGVVYEAVEPSLNRHVALKVLPALVSSMRPGSAARFKAEAEAAASLQHAHIVPIFAYGEGLDCHYYAMELIRGIPLSKLITQQDALPGSRDDFGRIARWIADVADALDFAHGRGVVHRDIKPSNLILSDDGRVLITDFGLAKAADADDLSQSAHVLGTWRYMSPEQLQRSREDLDHRTDIYSLGATLYELMTQRPAVAGSHHEIIHHVLHVQPEAPRRLNPAIPRDLQTICLKALAKAAPERYATAAQMADDLRSFLDERPIKARKPSLTQQVLWHARKHRVFAAVTLVLTLALTSVWTASAYLDAARQAIELQHENNSLRIVRAREQMDRGHFNVAAAVYSQVLLSDPNLTYVYASRARARGHLGQFAPGIADLDVVIRATPQRAALYINRGILHWLNDDAEQALRDFDAAFRLGRVPGVEAVVLTAGVTRRMGQPEDAVAIVEAALSATPTATSFLPRLIDLWVSGVRPEELIELTPGPRDQALVSCVLGEFYLDRQDMISARMWFQRAADNPRGSHFVRLLGACRYAELQPE